MATGRSKRRERAGMQSTSMVARRKRVRHIDNDEALRTRLSTPGGCRVNRGYLPADLMLYVIHV